MLDLPPEPCCDTKLSECSNDIPSRLMSRKRALEAQLNETNAAIKAMEENPEVTKVITLISKAIGRY